MAIGTMPLVRAEGKRMPGRPRKPESERLGYMLRIRMHREDRELLERAAQVDRLEMSSWARRELVALARRILAKQAVAAGK